MDRTERFYKIQALLRQNGTVTMRQMCDLLEVSRATVCRDLDYLRDRLGLPVVWDAGDRAYRLEGLPGHTKAQELPGIWFSEREIHALLSMIELLAQLEPDGLLSKRLAPFRDRLEHLLEQGTGSAAEALRRIRVMPMAQRRVGSDQFQRLAHALLTRKRLTIDYYARQVDETTTREISPQRLVYYRDNWYLDAYCHLRRGLRSFALDAIRSAELVPRPALEVPPDELTRFYDGSYGIFNGPSRQVARLKFSAFRARWVSFERWHPDQVSQWLADGTYLLEVPYGEDWELIQDILKQGPDVEVLAPAELRDKVSEAVQRLHTIYC